MKKHVGRGILSALVLSALLAGMVPVAAAEAEKVRPTPSWAGGSVDPEEKITVLVELEAAPAAELATYGSRGEEDYKAALMEAQEDVVESAQSELELEVGYQYNTIFNGFSCKISAGDADALTRMEGVKAVYPVQHYAAPEAVQREPAAMPQMAQSGAVTGSAQMTADGFGGQGMVVAVLDSGLNLDHPAFGVYEDMLGTVALTQDAVTAKLAAPEADGGTGGRGMYVSAKIPFACNYTDLENSTTITHGNTHGTHVAGIAAGYEEDDQGTAAFSGSAPGAQILGMQIFGDEGGTSADIYLKALEDAFNLGADVVNMSLGVPNGYSSPGGTDNPEEAIYARMANAGVLVCVSAGNNASYFQSWGAQYPDYASVASPSTYGSNISVAGVDNAGSGASADGTVRFSKSYSSLGPATTLDIRPTLTSVGGAVISANAEYTDGTDGKDKYVSQWGTSMSAPNLAGTFAALLDYLRGTKGLAKAEAGEVARKLMESSATLVIGEGDRLSTVMQQGAGLGNSASAKAAYEHGAYLEDPLQELRDDPEKRGSYTMTLTLKNATGSAVTYTPGGVVMTDDVVDGVNTQNSHILYKTGETITPAMAEVTFSQETVTVPANGTATVTATVSLTEAGKTYMNETFPKGGYIDGFITFTPPQGSNAPEVHATYLAFYGDWGGVPALAPFAPLEEPITLPEGASPSTVPASEVKLGFCNFKENDRPWREDYLPLGENPMNGWNATDTEAGDTAPYKSQHAAFPGGYKTDVGDDHILYNSLVVDAVALRNIESLTFAVTTGDGTENYRVSETGRIFKSNYDGKTDSWSNSWSFSWDAYSDSSGQGLVSGTRWLESGTAVRVTATAKMPYTRPGNAANATQTAVQFTLMVDHDAPTLDVENAVYDPEAGTLTLSATDEQYVAAVYLANDAGETVDCDLFSEETPNTAVTAALDVSGYTEGQTVKVRAMDYATNWVETEVTLTAAPAPVDPDPVTVTFDVNGGAQPASHSDYTQTVTVGETPTRPAADPTRTDYTFLGWAASAAGEVMTTFPVTVADTDVTYYAQWEAVSPTVSVALSYNETTKTITATPAVNLTQYNITYAWTENGETAPGATQGNTYTVPQDAQPGEHVYTCVATVTHPGDATKAASSIPVSQTVTVAQPVDPTPGPDDPGPDDPTPGPDDPGPDDPAPGPDDPGPDDPTPGPDDPGPDDPTPGPDDPGPDKPGPGEDKPTPGGDRPAPGGSVGGGAATASLQTTEKRKNSQDCTVAVVTSASGDKTFTVTDAAGKRLAQVKIPAGLAPLPGSERFADVPVGHWADEAIHRVANLGLFKGVSDKVKIFDMTSPVTRGTLTEVLYRLSNGEPDTVTYSFFDVAPDAWYTQSVMWATGRGVVNGTGAGTFQPQRAITRQELATMLYRYAQFLGAAGASQGTSLDGFLDGDLVDAWAQPGVAWCVQEGILQGKQYSMLDPTAQVTRGEAAAMLDRLLQVLE